MQNYEKYVLIFSYLKKINFFPIEIIGVIIDFYITKNIIETITSNLEFVIGYDKFEAFKILMKNTQCVISGSFIIECVLNEFWNGSDIDIYVPMKGNNIGKTDAGYFKSDVDDFMYEIVNLDGTAKSYPSEISGDIKWVRNYYKYMNLQVIDEIEVQIIGIDIKKGEDAFQEFICETFDFEICKNMCYISEDGNFNIKISNIVEILKKQTNFNSSKHLQSSILRYDKYTNRGFEFKNKDFLTAKSLKIKLEYENIDFPYIFKMLDFKSDCTALDKFFNYEIPVHQVTANNYYKTCHKNECIVYFCDKNVDHVHIIECGENRYSIMIT